MASKDILPFRSGWGSGARRPKGSAELHERVEARLRAQAAAYGLDPSNAKYRSIFDEMFRRWSPAQKVAHIDKLIQEGRDPSNLIGRTGGLPSASLSKGDGLGTSTSALLLGVGALILFVAVLR